MFYKMYNNDRNEPTARTTVMTLDVKGGMTYVDAYALDEWIRYDGSF